MGIHNPLPSSLGSKVAQVVPIAMASRVLTLRSVRTGECKKVAKILASFVDPRQAFGPDKVIPPAILANAKVRSTA